MFKYNSSWAFLCLLKLASAQCYAVVSLSAINPPDFIAQAKGSVLSPPLLWRSFSQHTSIWNRQGISAAKMDRHDAGTGSDRDWDTKKERICRHFQFKCDKVRIWELKWNFSSRGLWNWNWIEFVTLGGSGIITRNLCWSCGSSGDMDRGWATWNGSFLALFDHRDPSERTGQSVYGCLWAPTLIPWCLSSSSKEIIHVVTSSWRNWFLFSGAHYLLADSMFFCLLIILCVQAEMNSLLKIG